MRGGFSCLGCQLPHGLVVRSVFVQDKTSLQAHILMFHCFIYYVNSSTEYFSNWLGQVTPRHPSTPYPMCLFLHKGSSSDSLLVGIYLF